MTSAPPLTLTRRERLDLSTLFDLSPRTPCEVGGHSGVSGLFQVTERPRTNRAAASPGVIRRLTLATLREVLPEALIGPHVSSGGRLYPLAAYATDPQVQHAASGGLASALMWKGPYRASLQSVQTALDLIPGGTGSFLSTNSVSFTLKSLLMPLYGNCLPRGGLLHLWYAPGQPPRFQVTFGGQERHTYPLHLSTNGPVIVRHPAGNGTLALPLALYRDHEWRWQPYCTQQLLQQAGHTALQTELERAGCWTASQESMFRYCRLTLTGH